MQKFEKQEPSAENPRSFLIRKLNEMNAREAPDSEVFGLLDEYIEKEATKVPNTPEASIKFNLETARLYLAAGFNEQSYDYYTDVYERALQEGMGELADSIMAEMEEIRSKRS